MNKRNKYSYKTTARNIQEQLLRLFLFLMLGWVRMNVFIRKVKKIFDGAAVDKRYSIMDPLEVFTNTSFEEHNDIYTREVIDLGESASALNKSVGI
jgi:predicted naringenin-chalcone synthase